METLRFLIILLEAVWIVFLNFLLKKPLSYIVVRKSEIVRNSIDFRTREPSRLISACTIFFVLWRSSNHDFSHNLCSKTCRICSLTQISRITPENIWNQIVSTAEYKYFFLVNEYILFGLNNWLGLIVIEQLLSWQYSWSTYCWQSKKAWKNESFFSR